MSDEEKDDFIQYAHKYTDREGYAWGLKGIPSQDKQIEEKECVLILADKLGYILDHIDHEPFGRDTPPDVRIQLSDGSLVGIEITELVDEDMRAAHAARRGAERKRGLSPAQALHARDQAIKKAAVRIRMDQPLDERSSAFQEAYQRETPTPGRVDHYRFSGWDEARIAKRIDEIVLKKISKIESFRERVSAEMSKILLIVFTDEIDITEEKVFAAMKLGIVASHVFDSILQYWDTPLHLKAIP